MEDTATANDVMYKKSGGKARAVEGVAVAAVELSKASEFTWQLDWVSKQLSTCFYSRSTTNFRIYRVIVHDW